MNRTSALLAACLALPLAAAAASVTFKPEVSAEVAQDYPNLDALYKNWHTHPELSLQEKVTSAGLAQQLRAAAPAAGAAIGSAVSSRSR